MPGTVGIRYPPPGDSPRIYILGIVRQVEGSHNTDEGGQAVVTQLHSQIERICLTGILHQHLFDFGGNPEIHGYPVRFFMAQSDLQAFFGVQAQYLVPPKTIPSTTKFQTRITRTRVGNRVRNTPAMSIPQATSVLVERAPITTEMVRVFSVPVRTSA